MKFKKGNEILYGQDHKFFTGIPHNVEFEAIIDHNHMILTGPGFGEKGDYGSGAIYIQLPIGATLLRDVKENMGDIAFKAIWESVEKLFTKALSDGKRYWGMK